MNGQLQDVSLALARYKVQIYTKRLRFPTHRTKDVVEIIYPSG
jgi:hypothetical protein